ncbi:MAG TPA: protoporphyrinogen oxidase [Acidobacteriota bacterium]|nr:protoporphyrinogen oxidase [Acidobacteriota bacterium]
MVKRVAILGAGISGLSTAYFLRKNRPDVAIDVYEQSPRLGGVIHSDMVDGCVVDGGPDSFLTQKSAGIELCREIGLEDQLAGSQDQIRKTRIFYHGELKDLPDGLFLMVPFRILPFAKSELLSWPGKLAALSDLIAEPEEADLPVAQFVENRFGSEVLELIAEPLLSGVYGADVHRLGLQAALPQVWEWQKKGSLISAARSQRSGNRLSGSIFTTLSKGMGALIDALAEHTPAVNWKLSESVDEARDSGSKWTVAQNEYDVLILANANPPAGIGENIRSVYDSIRRNSAIVVVLGFDGLHRQGFGWLVPAVERRTVLACTYLSNKFAGRSAPGRFVIRLFIGGDAAMKWMDKSDSEILTEIRSEILRIDGIDREPLFFRIYKWRNAMPEYAVGHLNKIAMLDQISKSQPNLLFTGNLFYGVGLSDCIRHAKETALRASEVL